MPLRGKALSRPLQISSIFVTMRCAIAFGLLLPVIVAWSTGRLDKRETKAALASNEAHPYLSTRRGLLLSSLSAIVLSSFPNYPAHSLDEQVTVIPPSEVVASGDARQLFNEGRALETQGNIAAAQRLYAKVTKISPRFVYGWSNLGNTQVVLGALDPADDSYSRAIDLCRENLLETANQGFGTRRCDDLYVLLLNRGSLRLNNGRAKEALADLSQSSVLRGRPDAIVAQNLARAKELNGMYAAADSDYNLAISMTANEVSPFWLRSALVKFQLGDVKGGFDLLKRVENRFPEAPEVRAAYASFLAATGKQIEAQRKFLDIPDRQRMNYFNDEFLRETVSWPPVVIEALAKVTSAVEKPINKS